MNEAQMMDNLQARILECLFKHPAWADKERTAANFIGRYHELYNDVSEEKLKCLKK